MTSAGTNLTPEKLDEIEAQAREILQYNAPGDDRVRVVFQDAKTVLALVRMARRSMLESAPTSLTPEEIEQAEHLASHQDSSLAFPHLFRKLLEERHHMRRALDCIDVPTEMWGQPIGMIRAALNFLEEHTGTTIIPAALKRLGDVLRSQRNRISEQSAKNGQLEAENAQIKAEWAGLQSIREGLHRVIAELRKENEELRSRVAKVSEGLSQ